MIRNETRKQILSERSAIMRTTLQKGLGLMFQARVRTALIFPYIKPRIIPIHMLFVFTPIDIIFLNEKKHVVEIVEKLMPFTLYTSREKASTFIELPSGTIKKTGTRLNDHVSF